MSTSASKFCCMVCRQSLQESLVKDNGPNAVEESMYEVESLSVWAGTPNEKKNAEQVTC